MHKLMLTLAALTMAAGAVVVPRAAAAQTPTTTAEANVPPSGSARPFAGVFNWRGSFGGHHLDAARPLPGGSLVLSLNAAYFRASDFIAAGDDNERNTQQVVVTYAPIEMLELSLAQKTTTNTNAGPRDAPFESGATQTLGDPILGVKFSTDIVAALGLGALVTFMIPTSPRGEGLKPEAFRLNMAILASYAPISWLDISLNAGYQLDNTGKLFARQLAPVLRFASGVSDSSLVTAGLVINTDFAIAEVVGLGPFVEYVAGFGSVASGEQSPMLAALGVKVYPAKSHAVELDVGANVRLTGAPVAGGKLPGLPPWELFGRLSVNLFPPDTGSPTTIVASGPRSCSADSDCDGGLSCSENACVKIKEVIKEVVSQVAGPTFQIEGTILADDTGKPLTGAEINLSGSGSSPLSADRDNGKYKTYALPGGEGLVKITVTAPGYAPAEQTIPKGAPNSTVALDFKLKPLDEAAVGQVRGSIKDARNGKPVGAEVFFPSIGKKFKADNEGKFEATVKAGRYNVLISARGYVTQKKEIEIRPGDVVILNLDMSAGR